MPRTEPQRSCLGCRAVKDKKDLLRFVLAPDMTLVPDLQARLPGRGAYTCLKRSCLLEAAVRKQFSRTFKVEARFGSPEVLANLVASRMEERIAGYLALANKAGQVASGGDAVAERLGGGKAGIICLAADISPDIARKVIFQTERAGV